MSNRPVLDMIADIAVSVASRQMAEHVAYKAPGASPLPPHEPVKEAIKDALAKAPEVVNATNSEPWWQSRVVTGLIGVLVMLAVQWGLIAAEDANTVVLQITTAVAGAAAVYALGGRLIRGLKPMWSRLRGR